ncbi:MAG: hypothetical protein J0L58_05500 [Burkholderiales bacterium]|nr:hypothetical protein [Burkholderiales bacterium]
MKLKTLCATLALGLAGFGAQAAIITSTLNGVTILGNTYNVTFHQDDDGFTTFNDVFGLGGPLLPFTAANGLAATQDLLAAVNAANFDTTPGFSDATSQGFQLIVDFTAVERTWFTGWRDTPGNNFSGAFGSFDGGRNDNNSLSIATFERVRDNNVPLPGSLALAGFALLALGAAQRRRA